MYDFAYITRDGGAGWGGLMYHICGERGSLGRSRFCSYADFHVRIMGKNIFDYYF